MVDSRNKDDFLTIIGDKQARRILAATSEKPQSAKELSDNLELSLPTVYRRLELLHEVDLIDDQMQLADDGNHYRVYECDFSSTVVSLNDGEFEVDIFRRESFAERLTDIWDDLQP